MHDFFAMGGYGAYVWGAYAVFFIVVTLDVIAPILGRRSALADLRGRLKRQRKRGETAP